MTKFYLPIHTDSGNRGCEGIIRGTAALLQCPASDLIAYTSDYNLDKKLKLDKIATLVPQKKISTRFKIIRKIKSILYKKDDNAYNNITYTYKYKDFLNKISSNDIMLSTGGDMLCYENNSVIYTNDYLHKKNIKTILWGCSIGPENLTPEKINTLKNFSSIYVRESLTEKTLKEIGIKNVFCFPDPAFILKPEKCNLPSFFNNDVIGINLSNYTIGKNGSNKICFKALQILFDYIINNTNLEILLIPHVLWKSQDDREINRLFQNLYQDKIHILNTDNMNYCQIRYVISKCKFFIGARTHSVISAYSTYVPTLALGYSIKSRGIATDLKLPTETIINCTNMTDEKSILKGFQFIVSQEKQIKENLQRVMPEYINALNDVKKKIIDSLYI